MIAAPAALCGHSNAVKVGYLAAATAASSQFDWEDKCDLEGMTLGQHIFQ